MARIDARALGVLFVLAVPIFSVACATEDEVPSRTLDRATIDVPGGENGETPGAAGGGNGGPGPGGGLGPASNGSAGARTCPTDRWCSTLYPPTWSSSDPPDAEGRFLHDFSFAGYRYGEPPPASPPGATYDVVAGYGADPTGARDATVAIQKAINAASQAGGGIVFFPAGTYRVDQALTVGASGVVLRGVGKTSVLRFTKARGMAYTANLTVTGALTRDAARLLAVDAPVRARELLVANASDLAPGDDVVVGWKITSEFVSEHGMTGVWTAFAGQYQPFFRSKVVEVDTSTSPHRVVLDIPLRYAAKMRDGAGIQKESGYVREVGIEHLGVTNAVSWDAAWAEHQVNVIALHDVADGWISDVHSVPAPGVTGKSAADKTAYHLRSSGILVESSKRVSVLGTSMEYPQNRGSGGNGYLFEVSRTSEVLLADCEARRGRHNFIQNWGFGNSGTVMLRCTSTGSEMLSLIGGELKPETAYSEHHHSLAMATLIDDCRLDDGFNFENRGAYSSGAGHTGTGSVVWRASGTGKVISKQYGWGYVIGPRSGVDVETDVDAPGGSGTAPEDFVEGEGQGETLFPSSLYEDQRARRLGRL